MPLRTFFITRNLRFILPLLYLLVIAIASLYRLTPSYECQTGGLFMWCTGWPETVMFLASLAGILVFLFALVPFYLLFTMTIDLTLHPENSLANSLFIPLIVLVNLALYYGIGLLYDRITSLQSPKPPTPTSTPLDTPEIPR